MKKENKTAGKTAFAITDEQEKKLIQTTKELSTVNSILEKVSINCGYKRFIVFSSGQDQIAVSANPDAIYFDETGKKLETIYEPELYEMLYTYFFDRKMGLLEKICDIYREGGAK